MGTFIFYSHPLQNAAPVGHKVARIGPTAPEITVGYRLQ